MGCHVTFTTADLSEGSWKAGGHEQSGRVGGALCSPGVTGILPWLPPQTRGSWSPEGAPLPSHSTGASGQAVPTCLTGSARVHVPMARAQGMMTHTMMHENRNELHARHLTYVTSVTLEMTWSWSQMGRLTCPGSHSQGLAEAGFEPQAADRSPNLLQWKWERNENGVWPGNQFSTRPSRPCGRAGNFRDPRGLLIPW